MTSKQHKPIKIECPSPHNNTNQSNSNDPPTTRWEMATSRLLPDWASIRKADDAKYAEAFARIENHYFVNKGWFASDAWILE